MASPHLPSDQKKLLITLGGIGLSIVFIGLYFEEVESNSLSESSGKAIGVVTISEDDVRRMPNNRLLWVELPVNKAVYERDTIRTGSHSMARVDLGKNGSFEIKSDSLVVLETQNEKLTVNLASGDLFLKGPIVAKVGDNEVRSTNGSVSISNNATSGKISIEAKTGSVKIAKHGEEKELQTGKRLNQTAEKTEIESFPFIKEKPLESETILLSDPSEKVVFKFSEQKSADKITEKKEKPVFKLLISNDKDFKQSSSLPLTQGQVAMAETALKEGNYFWKIVSAKDQKDLSTVGTFQIKWPPLLTWATESEAPQIVLKREGLKSNLSWSSLKGAVVYEWVLTRNDKPLYKDKVNLPRISWESERNSLWSKIKEDAELLKIPTFISVNALDSNEKIINSKPLSAALVFVDERVPRPPKNTSSEINFKTAKSFVFKWEDGGDDSKSYELKISDKSIMLSEPTAEVSIDQIQNLKSGDSAVVRALSATGIPSEWTEITMDPEKLSLALLMTSPLKVRSPLSGSTIISRGKNKIGFQWVEAKTEKQKAKNYEISIQGNILKEKSSKTLSFSKNDRTESTTYELTNLEPGNYSWKVRPVWEKFGPGPYSESQDFVVSGGATLEAPRIRAPATTFGD